MFRIFATLLSGFIAALSSATALAACMSVPDGWYAEANGGAAHLTHQDNDNLNMNRWGVGGNANLGYKFLPYVAAEIGYSLYANEHIDTSTGVKAATNRHDAYDVALKGIWPLYASGFEIFVKLGAGRIYSHININNIIAANALGLASTARSHAGMYGGAGMQYYFIPQLAGVIQWQRTTGNATTGSEDLFTLGFSFIFE